MKRKNIKFILMIILILSMILMTGCNSENSGGNTSKNDTLIYGSKDYTSINPALYEHGEINTLIFAGLTMHDEKNQVIPALAESWEWDKDSLTYTFHLRDGLTFHDGHPLTSEDVKFTLEEILNPENQSEIVSNYTDIEKIECPDDLTVKLKLSEANIAVPDYMTIGILPKHLLEGKDLATDEFNQKPIGAGPYKLTDWDVGQSITLEKFDNYYEGKANISTIIFKIVPDDDARALQLESGDIDMAQITPKETSKISKSGDFNVYDMKTADYRAIAYNFNSDFFSEHKELPNILSYAIDRDSIVRSILLDQGEIAYSPLQVGKFNNPNMEKFEYNPSKCERLLKSSGWSKGEDGYYAKDGKQLAFTIYAMADDSVRVDMAKVCAQNFQNIGVNAVAKAQAELDWENQDACIIGWGSPFDPDDHTYKVFSTGAGDNYTYYSNSKIDKILKKARSAENDKRRLALYKQFQEEMTKDMPYTFIAYVDANYAIKKNISGITKDTVLGHHGVGIFWNISKWTIE